jgi:hypothetical protein
LLSSLARLLGNNVNYIFELLFRDCDKRIGLYIVHEFVEIIHDLILKLLQFFELLVDVVEAGLAILAYGQGNQACGDL